MYITYIRTVDNNDCVGVMVDVEEVMKYRIGDVVRFQGGRK